ncbi:putative MFS family arabinose efflux permease [Motilibacter peucedani]|uniref:Putative MFS family arabinose efflux permease n=1 Tax=Motilibacter peucedani TaxID=598650 RepID=A0A420XVB6_9ACTN|nr:MFS transporter [Motilibacter peucedani]RKS80599.1 putative MFS family arabinose efflux permease [Motilibacter peucedani]
MTTWALVADAVPVYPVYALLFTDSGLGDGQVSALFALWSLVSALAEVPFGALADRVPRRQVLVAAGLVQAAGMACWTVAPCLAGFAAGFVLWGLSGALSSGAREALLVDGLVALDAVDLVPRALARLSAAELVAQLPAAVLASLLLPLGGYPLVGAASVGTCTAAAVLAARVPEPAPPPPRSEGGGQAYLAGLREAVSDVRRGPLLRAAVLALALVTGLDALEEYFGLLVHGWHVPLTATPAVLLVVSLAGALGGWVGGRLRPRHPAVLLAAAALLLGLAVAAGGPVAVALLACFYAGYRAVLVDVTVRLQERVERSRATVTSLASLATEGVGLAVFGLWALAGASGTPWLVAAVAVALAAAGQRRPTGRSRAVRSSRSTRAG